MRRTISACVDSHRMALHRARPVRLKHSTFLLGRLGNILRSRSESVMLVFKADVLRQRYSDMNSTHDCSSLLHFNLSFLPAKVYGSVL